MLSNYQKDDPIYGKVDLDDTYVTDAWLLEKYVGNNLFSWGSATTGGMGDNTTANKSSPIQIGRLSTWRSVATGGGTTGTFTLSTKTDGTLWTWGNNNVGQLGINNTTNISSPVQVGTLTNWKQVSVGRNFSAAVKTDNTLWTWGENAVGQLGGLAAGTGNTVNRSSPVQIGTAYSWKSVSAGGAASAQYTMAIGNDGELWAIGGSNDIGQLGDSTSISKSSPVQIGSLTRWSKVSSGFRHTMAIQTDGTLWGWGDHSLGALGSGSLYRTTAWSSPIQVGSLTTWASVAAGPGVYAIKNDGTLWVWGEQNSTYANNLGVGSTVAGLAYSSPVQIGSLTNWASVISNGWGGMSVKTNNTLWGWGTNTSGNLGNGSTATQSSPVQIGTLTNWSQVASKTSTTAGTVIVSTAAVKTDNTLWTWGNNASGQLGSGTTTTRSSPVQVGSLTNWAQVDILNSNTTNPEGICAAVKTNGTLWTWGRGAGGALGSGGTNGFDPTNGGTISRSSPVQVGSLTNWRQVQVGRAATSGALFTLAVKTDNTLWAWGDNTLGQYGTGATSTSRSSPVQVGSLSDWSSISVTSFNNLPTITAVKTNGTLWAWGSNTVGNLGNGSTATTLSSPVQIGTLTNWSTADASPYASALVKNDGAAAPIFIASDYATGSNSAVITKPSNVINGDLLFLWVILNNGTVTTPSGWTVVDNSRGDRGVYYKVASSEGSSYTVNTSGVVTSMAVGIVVFRNASFSVGGTISATSANPTIAPAITVASNNSIVLDFIVGGGGASSVNTAGYRLLTQGPASNNLSIFYKAGVSTGTTGTVSVTPSSGTTSSILVAISPTGGTSISYGSLWASGSNVTASFNGAIGQTLFDGSYYSSPVQVGSLTNWKAIQADDHYTLALKTDNTLWAWGDNSTGNLGDGTTIDKYSPVQVGFLTDWKSLAQTSTSTGSNHSPSGAVKTDGTLWLWGENNTGNLGDGTTVSKSSPIQIGIQTNWKQVATCDNGGAKGITFNDI